MESYLYDDLYELEEQHWWHRAKRELVFRLLASYSFRKHIKILDVGCGTGKNVETFAAFGESWGLDMSPRAITYCKKRGLTRVRIGEAEKTGLPSGMFDAITLLDVLEHTDDKKTLREMRRIMAPGGVLIMTIPAYQWLWSQWDVVLHHKRRYERTGLTALLKKEGFKVRKVSYVYSFLVIPVFLIRMIKSRLLSGQYASDFRMSSPVVNYCMLRVSRAEAWIVDHFFVPFGTSLVCVAQKSTDR